MTDEPFQLTIETRNECFASFFETQDEAESYLHRWANDNGYTPEENADDNTDDNLLKLLQAALVDVQLHLHGDDTCVRIALFERPLTAVRP
jgi:hypothetical protein